MSFESYSKKRTIIQGWQLDALLVVNFQDLYHSFSSIQDKAPNRG